MSNLLRFPCNKVPEATQAREFALLTVPLPDVALNLACRSTHLLSPQKSINWILFLSQARIFFSFQEMASYRGIEKKILTCTMPMWCEWNSFAEQKIQAFSKQRKISRFHQKLPICCRYVPYCSSDSWSGTYRSTTKGSCDFGGEGTSLRGKSLNLFLPLHNILTFNKLIPTELLSSCRRLFLHGRSHSGGNSQGSHQHSWARDCRKILPGWKQVTGRFQLRYSDLFRVAHLVFPIVCVITNIYSAGGIGVLLNLDHISGMLSARVPLAEVRGIADSGWFLDNEQYRPVGCNDAHSCAPTIVTRRGIQWVRAGLLSLPVNPAFQDCDFSWSQHAHTHQYTHTHWGKVHHRENFYMSLSLLRQSFFVSNRTLL